MKGSTVRVRASAFLRIDGMQTPKVAPGHSAKLTVTFTKPGRYPYLCTLPGHADAGMKGVLVVK